MTTTPRTPFHDFRPFYGQDPHVTPHKDGFLLLQSEDERRITITSLSDLETFHTNKTTTVWDSPQERQVWAPELHQAPDHHWLIYYAASDGTNETHRNYVLRSESPDPLSQYRFLGQVKGPGDDGDRWGIDLTLFRFNNARFAVWSGWPTPEIQQQNLYISRLISPTELAGRNLLSAPTLPWEQSHAPILEGPQFHYPYLFYAANASWSQDYATGVLELRGTNPLGSAHWRKHPTPLLLNAGHGHPIQGTDSFIYHTKLSPFPGWSDRVIQTIPTAHLPLERGLRSAID